MNNDTSSKLLKRLFGFSMASWVNCIISIISTPITTSLFVPEQLAKINLFISYANVLIPFVYLGFDQAYVRFYHETGKKNTSNSIFKRCLNISMFMSIIVSLIILLFWRYFSKSIIGFETISISICLSIYLFATMLLRYENLKARMENNVWLFFWQSVLSTIIIKLSFTCVALIKPNPLYAIYIRTILLLLLSIIFIVLIYRKIKSDKIYDKKEITKELSKFAIPVFPAVFLVMLNTSLSQLILKNYVDFKYIGIYSNAITIASIITIIQSGLNTFWTPFVYEYHKNQKKIQRMHHIVSYLMIIMALFIVMFQDIIYQILVNKQYWDSKMIMAFLLISPVSETIAETLGLGIELSKKTYLKIPVYITNIIVNVCVSLILIPKFGLIGAAISNAVASLSMMTAKTLIGEKYYKCSDTYFRLIISIILLMCNAVINYFYNIGMAKVAFSSLCIIIVTILYWETFKYLFNIVNSMIKKIIRGNKEKKK